MKRLSKTDSTRAADYGDQLAKAGVKVSEKFAAAQAAVEALNAEIEAFNELASEADGFREDIVNMMDEYMGERSEKWPDTDAGQAYDEWKQEWESATIQQLETVADLDDPTDDYEYEVLANLPTQPGG